jgi:hypothetical protein
MTEQLAGQPLCRLFPECSPPAWDAWIPLSADALSMVNRIPATRRHIVFGAPGRTFTVRPARAQTVAVGYGVWKLLRMRKLSSK